MVKTPTDHAILVGGGPAGLAAAIALRLKGLAVTVVDAATPPIDKACGEGLMPDGLAALAQLGVTLPPDSAHPFQGIRFLDGDVQVEANFPCGAGLGARRLVLHKALTARAEALGVNFRWGTPVRGLTLTGVELLHGENLAGRWIIGADGHTSMVRRWAGLDAVHHESRRYAFRRHYALAPWTTHMEIHWGPRCQAYITPVSSAEVCVVVMSHDPHLRLDAALTHFPRLQEKLRAVPISSHERGALTIVRRLRRLATDRVVLIGDASGSVDAITGDGLCLAFSQAVQLAEAFAANNLAHYEQQHRSLLLRPELMGRFMLLMDPYPKLRLRALRAMSSRPDIFASMLAMHVGAATPQQLLRRGLLPLGWRLLTQ